MRVEHSALELVERNSKVHVYHPVSSDMDCSQPDVGSVIDEVPHHSLPIVAFIRMTTVGSIIRGNVELVIKSEQTTELINQITRQSVWQ